jgi:hypothetical protein
VTRHFLDVSAVRIQSWLARSTTLAGRRGASAALAAATSTEAVSGILRPHAGAKINEDAGQVDGVIHVELDEPGLWQPVARSCLAHLRQRLPAVELTAVAGSGENYLAAYATEIKPNLRAQRVWRDVPALADFPPVMTCSRCRAGAAMQYGRPDPGEAPAASQPRICADCAIREDQAVARHAAGGPEAKLTEALPVDPEEPMFARTFTELARVPLSIDDQRPARVASGTTHLATVYADGNAVGALMDFLATRPGAGQHRHLAATITNANLASLAAATFDLWASDSTWELPVTPHVAAGDDLLVSLPAAAGWEFAIRYAEEYSAALAGAAPPGAPCPSVSAALVFAHATHPFAEVAVLAADVLKTAKRAVRGAEASLAWLDLTVDGRTLPPGRPVIPVRALTAGGRLDSRLRELAALEASQLARLEALAAKQTADALARHVERLGLQAEVAPFLKPAGNAAGLGLADALTLARWYVRSRR